ncbi:MAG: hypothetical protein ABI919_00395 [Ramlibacter sp.]
MRFHPSMFMMAAFISMGMHAMATAATPARDPDVVQRQDAAVRQAGKLLNEELSACRDEARKHPRASRRDLQICERAARRDFRREIKRARSGKVVAQ